MISLLSKVWYDLWGDKLRTLQVVLVIALGSIAIGLVIGGRNLIDEAVTISYSAAEPYHIRVNVTPPLTKSQLERVGKIEGVAQVEGLLTGGVEWRLSEDDEWQRGSLRGRDDISAPLMTPTRPTRRGVSRAK